MVLQSLFTWGNDQASANPVGGAGWPQARTPSTSPSGADQADARVYGTSRNNGSYAGTAATMA